MSSDFQREVQAAVEDQLHRLGLTYTTDTIDAADDSYVVVKPAGVSERVEIYIYLHEVGFFLGNDWHMFEKCDYDDERILKYTFLDGLYRALSKSR